MGPARLAVEVMEEVVAVAILAAAAAVAAMVVAVVAETATRVTRRRSASAWIVSPNGPLVQRVDWADPPAA